MTMNHIHSITRNGGVFWLHISYVTRMQWFKSENTNILEKKKEKKKKQKRLDNQIRYLKYSLPQSRIQMEHHVPVALSQTPKKSHKNTRIVIWRILTLFRRGGGGRTGKGHELQRGRKLTWSQNLSTLKYNYYHYILLCYFIIRK